MAINIQNIIAALEAKVAAATSATETQELIVLIKTIKASGQSIIASYATSSALPTATSANAGNIAFVSDVAKLFYSNGTTWAEVGSGSGSGGTGGTAYNQSLNTTDDVVFNSALIGSIALIDNTLSAIDVYGNLDKLTISSPLEVTAQTIGLVTTSHQFTYLNYNGMMGTPTLTFGFDTATLTKAQRSALASSLIATEFVVGNTVTTSAILNYSSYSNESLKFVVSSATPKTDDYDSTSVVGVIVSISGTILANGSVPMWATSGNGYDGGTISFTTSGITSKTVATLDTNGLTTIDKLTAEGDFAVNKSYVDNGSGQITFGTINGNWSSSTNSGNTSGKDQIAFPTAVFTANDLTQLLALPANTTLVIGNILLNGYSGWESNKTVTLATAPTHVMAAEPVIVFTFNDKLFSPYETMYGLTSGGVSITNFFNYAYTKNVVTKLIDVTNDVLSVGGVKVNATTPINAGAVVLAGELQPQALNVYNKVIQETKATSYYNSAPETGATQMPYMAVSLSFMSTNRNVYYENPNNMNGIPKSVTAGDILKIEFTRYDMMAMTNSKWIINAVVKSSNFSNYATGQAGQINLNDNATITYSKDGGTTFITSTLYDIAMNYGNDLSFNSMSASDLRTTYQHTVINNPLQVKDSGLVATNVVANSGLVGNVAIVGNTLSAIDSYGLPNGNLAVESNVIFDKDVTFSGQVVSVVNSTTPTAWMKVFAKVSQSVNVQINGTNFVSVGTYGSNFIDFTFDDMYGTVKNNVQTELVKNLKAGDTIDVGSYYGNYTYTVTSVVVTTTYIRVYVNTNTQGFYLNSMNNGDTFTVHTNSIVTTPYYLPLVPVF